MLTQNLRETTGLPYENKKISHKSVGDGLAPPVYKFTPNILFTQTNYTPAGAYPPTIGRPQNPHEYPSLKALTPGELSP